MTTPFPMPDEDDRPDAEVLSFPTKHRVPDDADTPDAPDTAPGDGAPDASDADVPAAPDGAEDAVRVDPDVSEPGYIDRARSATARPILPGWLTSADEARSQAGWFVRHHTHIGAFHAVRVPVYAARLVGRSPLGAWRLVVRVVGWTVDAEGAALRMHAATHNDPKTYVALSDRRDRRVRSRMTVATALGLAVLAGALAASGLAPVTRWTLFTLVLMGLGLFGGRKDRPLAGPAVVSGTAPKLTADVVIRALAGLGIAGVNQALAPKGSGITFPEPITRDGPGWRAAVDLPHGVTAVDVIERRDRLASGLRRPLGCVWPEPVHDEHAGRLVIWVGDQDLTSAKAPAWPLAKTGRADIFAPVPFGVDPRGRAVSLTPFENNGLFGAMPGAGKSASLRNLVLGCAMDPTSEHWLFNLKPGVDWLWARAFATRFENGVDAPQIEATARALADLKAEIIRRGNLLATMPLSAAPDGKVTRALADRKDLGLHPLVVTIDECQNLFADKAFGKQAGEDAEYCIKLGRFLGVILLLATQRPDRDSLPTGVSANVSIRFCLRVIGQVENDMVLGTSAYKNGIRATELTARDKGIGYLIGTDGEPQVVKGYYIDLPSADKYAARARAMREANGTLSGVAAGAPSATAQASGLAADIAAVLHLVVEDKVWGETLLELLREHDPKAYAEMTGAQLTNQLKVRFGITARQIFRRVNGKQINQRGYDRAELAAAIAKFRTGTDSE